ncbi:hypothetical protein [Streptomyces sp. NPDC127108]|uniref:hypothetical protein n=1 Tax=Streptomyces sp. NPDC127108 TaxID=3345361 RepID=UPI003645A6EF
MLLPLTHEKAELIEVVRITAPETHLRAEHLAGDEVAIWDGPRASRALALIGDLRGSELHRCFFPGWGVRVHSATDLLFRLAFCFECHGVRLWGPGVPADQEGIEPFDPASVPARELLREFRGVASG